MKCKYLPVDENGNYIDYWTLVNDINNLYEYIKELEKIKDNWDELKKWVKYHYDYYINSHDYIGGRLCFADIKNKIEKLEQEGDKNEF